MAAKVEIIRTHAYGKQNFVDKGRTFKRTIIPSRRLLWDNLVIVIFNFLLLQFAFN